MMNNDTESVPESPNSILRYLESTRELYTKYAHHKETMAWAGVAAYALVVGQLVSKFGSQTTSSVAMSAVVTAMLVALSVVVFEYVRRQFRQCKLGTNNEGACLALFAEMVSNSTGNGNPAEYAPPKDDRASPGNEGKDKESDQLSDYVLAGAVRKRAKLIAKHGQEAREHLHALAGLIMVFLFVMAVLVIWLPHIERMLRRGMTG